MPNATGQSRNQCAAVLASTARHAAELQHIGKSDNRAKRRRMHNGKKLQLVPLKSLKKKGADL
jgi:hypothetical protein